MNRYLVFRKTFDSKSVFFKKVAIMHGEKIKETICNIPTKSVEVCVVQGQQVLMDLLW